jgi:hypothetical protein
MVRLIARSLAPLSHQQVVSLSQSSCVSPIELPEGIGGGVGVGEEQKLYNREKAWQSINHSVLSGLYLL